MELHKRAWCAIGLGLFVVLSQVAAISLLARNGLATLPAKRQIQWGYHGRTPNEVLTLRESRAGTQVVVCELDLKSGQLRDVGIEIPTLGANYGVLADKKHVWAIDRHQVTRTDGHERQDHRPQRPLSAPLSIPFLYEGKPAIIDLDDDGVKYCLLIFHGGQWHRAGEVAIPGMNRNWVKNEATGEFVLQPGVSAPPVGAARVRYVTVFAANNTLHLFYRDYSEGITAYREGLDLIPLNSDVASALAPENTPAETTGWTKLEFSPGLYGVGVQRNHLVVVEQESLALPIRFWEKPLGKAGQPFRMTLEIKATASATLALLESHEHDVLYFIRDRDWNPSVQRYQDGHLQELSQPWESDLTRTADWLFTVSQPILIVLLLANLTLLAGSEWISRIETVPFEHGPRRFALASVSRRAFARSLDLALLLAVAVWHLFHLGFRQIVVDSYEFSVHSTISQTATEKAFYQSIAWAGVVAFILIVCQARWGQTPGKWICGIKVLRSTSYRCGLARSLMRELMLVIDAPGVTILPGIICLLLNNHRQRIGDLMADTVVVNIRELANADQGN